MPDGETVVRNYLISIDLPPEQVSEVACEFQDLFTVAVAGDRNAADVRFTLLELKYC